MYRKIIGGIISVVIITIMGIGKLDFIKQDNSVEEMEVSKVEQAEEINEDENENTTQDNPENEVEEIIKDEVTIPEKNENSIKAENTIATKSNGTQTSKKQETKEKQEVQKNTNEKINNQKVQEENKQEDVKQDNVQKTEKTEQKEQKKEETKKEEYIYNDTATKQIMADIDEIAKKNPDLWGKNGEKLYKIEICANLVGKNYMCPYRKAQVEGQVLNVYPVKFLVYAVDYKRTGFATETRYYIDITNY